MIEGVSPSDSNSDTARSNGSPISFCSLSRISQVTLRSTVIARAVLSSSTSSARWNAAVASTGRPITADTWEEAKIMAVTSPGLSASRRSASASQWAASWERPSKTAVVTKVHSPSQ